MCLEPDNASQRQFVLFAVKISKDFPHPPLLLTKLKEFQMITRH